MFITMSFVMYNQMVPCDSRLLDSIGRERQRIDISYISQQNMWTKEAALPFLRVK